MSFLKVASAGKTLQLPPGSTTRMAVGTEITQADPALIRTVRMRTEMGRCVDITPPPSGEGHAGWRGRRGLTAGLGDMFTCIAVGLVGEPRNGFRVAGALAGWQRRLGSRRATSGPAGGPYIVEDNAQPEKSQ
jgi:hypothetical protein